MKPLLSRSAGLPRKGWDKLRRDGWHADSRRLRFNSLVGHVEWSQGSCRWRGFLRGMANGRVPEEAAAVLCCWVGFRTAREAMLAVEQAHKLRERHKRYDWVMR